MGTNFLKIFASSPFKPIQQHMACVTNCAEGLIPFLGSVFAEDWEQAKAHQKTVVDLEDKADDIKRKIRLGLPSNLFLPVSRSDLLELLTTQDKIANITKDITGLILGRKMIFPAELAAIYQKLVERSIDACKQANKAIDELDELLETGFRGQEADLVKAMIVELEQVETESDDIQVEVRSILFRMEESLPPINVMFLYKVIYKTGIIADYAQQVGHRLQLLLAK